VQQICVAFWQEFLCEWMQARKGKFYARVPRRQVGDENAINIFWKVNCYAHTRARLLSSEMLFLLRINGYCRSIRQNCHFLTLPLNCTLKLTHEMACYKGLTHAFMIAPRFGANIIIVRRLKTTIIIICLSSFICYHLDITTTAIRETFVSG
jgi:hypothetical protein